MKPDWTTIKADYVETAMTLAEVQGKHGVARGTLSARATRENWNDEKQQFAANLEQQRRKKILALRVAEQEKFEDGVMKVASRQLMMIANQMQDATIDPTKVLKLANALEKVQRIGCAAFGGKS